MKHKDFQMGLNHIDEELIAEAAAPAKAQTSKSSTFKKYRKVLTGLAAVFAVCIIGVTAFQMYGTQADEDPTLTASTGGNTGEYYAPAESYSQIYDAIEEGQEVSFGMAQPKVSAAGGATLEESVEADAALTSNGDHSSTNLMTEGVDEGDIVKTDGNYIYMVDGGSVVISNIQGDKPETVKTLAIPFEAPSDTIAEIYLSEDKLVVIANHYDNDKDSTYCYVYNISNPAKPKLTGSMHQDGSYNTSRMIDGQVYLMTNNYLFRPDFAKSTAIADDKLADWLPQVNDQVLPCDCFLIHENNTNAMVISSFSVDNPSKARDMKCILSSFANIYVSQDNIYIYESDYTSSRELTNITQVKLNKGKIKLGKTTSVNGSITDAFAINEKGGYLRVLASDRSGSTETNTLFILDGDMQLSGRIDGIARGEQVYAARYVGDLVYFITYKNVDPLFVADLSDPENPKLLGSLEVEGFSEYLHMWDDTHVLGIGYNQGDVETDVTDDVIEDTVEEPTNSLVLTMFDVSDPLHPVVEDQFTLKGYYYSSAVDGEYKAIMISPEKGLIGFPVVKSNTDTWEDQTKYELFTYSDDEGFSVRSATNLDYDQWGYRGLFSGDRVFVAGNGQVIEIK